MKAKYNIVELFSGIGSQVKALKNINFDINVQAICEWDIHAFLAYDAIHNTSTITNNVSLSREFLIQQLSSNNLSKNGKDAISYKALNNIDTPTLNKIYYSIKNANNLIDISNIKGSLMPIETDILTYSFPCQDLSNVGAFHGYIKGIIPDCKSRSSLIWEVGRILEEMVECNKNLPRYLVMENVPTLLSQRHKPYFEKWKETLNNLGYKNKEIILNARDFGLPQNRQRLLMISIFVGNDLEKANNVLKYFEKLNSEKVINDYKQSIFFKSNKIKDFLRIPSSKDDVLWDEALDCTPNDTVSRRKIWNENPQIVNKKGEITSEKFIRTITTKQDRHPNSGNIYFDCGVEGKSKFRYLTPRECLLFMGFTDNDYENLLKNNLKQKNNYCIFTRDKIIRMAGNSIPVTLLEGFFYQFYEIEKI